ncbi:MAG: hypothetical protein L0Y58_02830 [Verrucomicrobia subdivision 3 bacterium]|nr:hypothetical protein [Limisphaerales bacterium]
MSDQISDRRTQPNSRQTQQNLAFALRAWFDGSGMLRGAVLQQVLDGQLCRRVARRLAGLVVLAVAIGWVLHHCVASVHRSSRPAGFATGLLHGALMPLALPNLLVGDDVVIYAPNNTGRTYKLGYTAGVNGCGLVFFGFFFWRVKSMARGRRWLINSKGVRV